MSTFSRLGSVMSGPGSNFLLDTKVGLCGTKDLNGLECTMPICTMYQQITDGFLFQVVRSELNLTNISCSQYR